MRCYEALGCPEQAKDYRKILAQQGLPEQRNKEVFLEQGNKEMPLKQEYKEVPLKQGNERMTLAHGDSTKFGQVSVRV